MALAKAAVNHACAYTWNSTKLEDGHMARMWNEILRQLDDPSWAKGLQGKITECPELAVALGTRTAQVSSSMRWNHAPLFNGDIGFFHDCTCLVIGCGRTDGTHFVLVRWGSLVAMPTQTSSAWKFSRDVDVLKLNSDTRFVRACCWRVTSDGYVLVLH